MEGEWHTSHRIEEVSNLIILLREYKINTITRNVMRCNNRDDLLNLSFILKIPIFSEVYWPSQTSMMQCFFSENRQWVLTQWVKQKINLEVVGASLASVTQVKWARFSWEVCKGAVSCPSRGCFGAESPYKSCLASTSVIDWLKIYLHLVVFFFPFFFYFLYVLSLRALKKIGHCIQIWNSAALLAIIMCYFKWYKTDFVFSLFAVKLEFSKS